MVFRSMALSQSKTELIRKALYLSVLLMWWFGQQATAHDKHYAISKDMHNWFMTLQSGKGPCCADADGNVVQDADWDSHDGHYRVRLDGKWVDVPDEAVIKAPNLYGPTMVWPMIASPYGGPVRTDIRCFMPGSMM